MTTPTLILIIGLPGTGKTVLSQKLATQLNLPLISKDPLKEIIFDDIGWSDREWSKKVGIAAYHIMDYIIESQLKAGNSLIVESTFNPKFDNQTFQTWQQTYRCNIVQILCYADGTVLLDRFTQRAKTNEVHPGHAQNSNDHQQEFRDQLLKGKAEPLDLDGQIIEVDTTDFAKVDHQALFAKLNHLRPLQK